MKQQLNIVVSLAYTAIFLLLMGLGVLRSDPSSAFAELCDRGGVEAITSVSDRPSA